MFRRYTQPLSRLVLGDEPRQRRHLSRYLLSAGVYAFSLTVQLGMAVGGRVPHDTLAYVFTILASVVVIGFYVAIRSLFTRRFADPALTAAQMSFAIVALALAYAINPIVRGMILMIVALVLIYGAFTLPPASCRRLGWFSVAVLGLTMGLSTLFTPSLFDPTVEVLHFIFCAVVLPTIAILAGQLSRLRADAHAQKVELREALERIRLLATRDELTGLPNRRHAQDLMALQATRSQLAHAPLCVCLFDLDHFKRINDTLGHAAGDEVLRVVARQAQPVLRASDVLARWGGEEFLLMLPDTSVADAEHVVRRLRERLADTGTWREWPELRVTFSGGITRYREGEDLQETIARADTSLYRAKSAGRDRVLLAA